MTTWTAHAPFIASAVATAISSEAAIPAGDAALAAELSIPRGASGLVIFAHGSGSSHKSGRNRLVAERLRARGFGTLLFDRLTAEEQRLDDDRFHFDLGLSARRLGLVTDWVRAQSFARSLPIGYFGSSTGAAVAIVAAASRPETVKAIVSRGGRPDLAASVLRTMRTPLLLLVGSEDPGTLALNEIALQRAGGLARLKTVAGAGHLFAEPGALDTVAELASEWFCAHLAPHVLERAEPHGS